MDAPQLPLTEIKDICQKESVFISIEEDFKNVDQLKVCELRSIITRYNEHFNLTPGDGKYQTSKGTKPLLIQKVKMILGANLFPTTEVPEDDEDFLTWNKDRMKEHYSNIMEENKDDIIECPFCKFEHSREHLVTKHIQQCSKQFSKLNIIPISSFLFGTESPVNQEPNNNFSFGFQSNSPNNQQQTIFGSSTNINFSFGTNPFGTNTFNSTPSNTNSSFGSSFFTPTKPTENLLSSSNFNSSNSEQNIVFEPPIFPVEEDEFSLDSFSAPYQTVNRPEEGEVKIKVILAGTGGVGKTVRKNISFLLFIFIYYVFQS